MILVIDNYDCFVYNLVQYLGEMNPKIEVYRNDCISLVEISQKAPSHILLSSGYGRPEKAGISVDIFRTFAGRIPILGVGVGFHAFAFAFGSQIVQSSHPVHAKTNEICHDGRTIFHSLEYRFRAITYHPLVIDRNLIPLSLEVSATTPDGIIMGLRHSQFACEGIQFHPESIATSPGKALIRNFLGLTTPQ